MNFSLTLEEQEYKKELISFLKKEANANVVSETESMQGIGPYGKELLRKMGAKKLLAPSWPEEYWGRGLSFMTQGILNDQMRYHLCPWPIDGLVVGATILRFGTEYQKKKYLIGVAKGEIDIALGYTEPGAGSDIASIQLRAVEKGDVFILNGQKVYNTETHHSEYHWLLTRTDPTVSKHKGLSLFVVDLRTPGITIRPLKTSAGLRTNEVFYEDVEVPKEDLIGGKNRGWDIVMSALGSERTMWSGDIRHRFEQFLEYLISIRNSSGINLADQCILDELAKLTTKLRICQLLSSKSVSMLDRGMPLIYEQSVTKLFISETRKKMFDVFMQILGQYGELADNDKWTPLNGVIPREYIDSSRWTIVAGTSEIQRLIIALRGLELPK